jgi:hypothetical protein
MEKDIALTEYVKAVLEAYMNEEFADVTRKSNSVKPAASPPGQQQFSLDQLQKIGTLEQVLGYINATLGSMKIGEGQGRLVYKLGGGKVLKVAKNPGGMGQNQAEAHVCDGSSEASDLFPNVFQVGPNNFWLVTEEASPMTPQAFESLTGLPWKTFQSGLKGAFESKALNVSDFDKQNYIEASRNPFFSRIVRIIQECKYEPGDIAKLDSWGVIGGQPVILDSGFTEAVNQAYYKE